jgi:hypothetical protein
MMYQCVLWRANAAAQTQRGKRVATGAVRSTQNARWKCGTMRALAKKPRHSRPGNRLGLRGRHKHQTIVTGLGMHFFTEKYRYAGRLSKEMGRDPHEK